MASLHVRDAMTRTVYAVGPRTSLETAARLLAMKRITGLPVIDDDAHLIGVITQTDLVDPDRGRSSELGLSHYYRVTHGKTEALGDDSVADQGIVADLMTPFTVATTPDAPLLDAVRLMVSDRIHRLFVRDGGRLAGVLSSMDVLRAIGEYADRLAVE